MSKKSILVLVTSILVVLAVTLGVCLIFFINPPIKEVPSFAKVEEIDNEFCLVTEFNPNYEYKFVAEQFLDDKYSKVDEITTDKNVVALKDFNLNLEKNNKFRFSTCYKNEKSEGKFSNAVEWQFVVSLEQVDYSSVKFENKTLTWGEVENAEKYQILLLDQSGEVLTQESQTNSYDFQTLAEGKFKCYIIALAGDQKSLEGEGVTLENYVENTLTASFDGVLKIVSDKNVNEFEVWQGEQLVVTLIASNFEKVENKFVYTFENINFALDSSCKISSKAMGYVKESEKTTVVFE